MCLPYLPQVEQKVKRENNSVYLYTRDNNIWLMKMQRVFFQDNYCYEITELYLSVYKYDIFENNYYIIDKCLLSRLPHKYQSVLQEYRLSFEPVVEKNGEMKEALSYLNQISIASSS